MKAIVVHKNVSQSYDKVIYIMNLHLHNVIFDLNLYQSQI